MYRSHFGLDEAAVAGDAGLAGRARDVQVVDQLEDLHVGGSRAEAERGGQPAEEVRQQLDRQHQPGPGGPETNGRRVRQGMLLVGVQGKAVE